MTVEIETLWRAPVGESAVVVGLELTGFITGAAGKLGPFEVAVLEGDAFKVGVFTCWHKAVTTNCPRRIMTRRTPRINFIVFSFVTPVAVVCRQVA
jgi:hypothetical protein